MNGYEINEWIYKEGTLLEVATQNIIYVHMILSVSLTEHILMTYYIYAPMDVDHPCFIVQVKHSDLRNGNK